MLADLDGWRTVYRVAATLLLAMSAVLWRILPDHRGTTQSSYLRLLLSIIQLYREEPLLRARSLIGGLLFACFSML